MRRPRSRRDGRNSGGDDDRPVLTPAEYAAIRFVIDLVDRLGAEHGFDPAALVNPRSGERFGPFLARTRAALRRYELRIAPDDRDDD